MKYFLTSILFDRIVDQDGNRLPCPMLKEFDLQKNIAECLPGRDKFVLIANETSNYIENDSKLVFYQKCLEMSNMSFKEYAVLDDRNTKQAKEILDGADLILLTGGKCISQNDYCHLINLKEITESSDAVMVGVSAGAMNMCDTVANFPEELADIGQPLWLKGLGFYDKILIPHFDGDRVEYQIPCDEIDIAHDHILPLSKHIELLAIPNFSYVMIKDGITTIHGKYYEINNGVITPHN